MPGAREEMTPVFMGINGGPAVIQAARSGGSCAGAHCSFSRRVGGFILAPVPLSAGNRQGYYPAPPSSVMSVTFIASISSFLPMTPMTLHSVVFMPMAHFMLVFVRCCAAAALPAASRGELAMAAPLAFRGPSLAARLVRERCLRTCAGGSVSSNRGSCVHSLRGLRHAVPHLAELPGLALDFFGRCFLLCLCAFRLAFSWRSISVIVSIRISFLVSVDIVAFLPPMGCLAAPVLAGAAAGATFPTPLGLLLPWRSGCSGAAPRYRMPPGGVVVADPPPHDSSCWGGFPFCL
jgi:hypothetical protein